MMVAGVGWSTHSRRAIDELLHEGSVVCF